MDSVERGERRTNGALYVFFSRTVYFENENVVHINTNLHFNRWLIFGTHFSYSEYWAFKFGLSVWGWQKKVMHDRMMMIKCRYQFINVQALYNSYNRLHSCCVYLAIENCENIYCACIWHMYVQTILVLCTMNTLSTIFCLFSDHAQELNIE